MRLGLGSVQFGLPYGVTNTSGQVASDEVKKILGRAAESGIQLIDTAAAYGEAEQVVGDALSDLRIDFQVVTKSLPLAGRTIKDVRERFNRSLQNLNLLFVDGFLFHNGADLLGPHGQDLFSLFRDMRSEGKIRKIGVSVYSPDEALTLLEAFPFELVQLPLNVFDQRFLKSGALDTLRSRGVEIHARSVFLQGALLAEERDMFRIPDRLTQSVRDFQQAAIQNGVTAMEAALYFVRRQNVEVVIVGVTSLAELVQLINVWERVSSSNLIELPWSSFAQAEEVVDPRKWT